MENLTVQDATHLLSCRHCQGRYCKEYYMRCLILKDLGNRAKILVFGERDWKDRDHIKRIRYVDKYRIQEI